MEILNKRKGSLVAKMIFRGGGLFEGEGLFEGGYSSMGAFSRIYGNILKVF